LTTHVHTQTYTQTHTYTGTHTYTDTNTHVHTQTHTHTHTHTHIVGDLHFFSYHVTSPEVKIGTLDSKGKLVYTLKVGVRGLQIMAVVPSNIAAILAKFSVHVQGGCA